MTYNKHRKIIGNLKPDNTISDENCSVSYEMLDNLLSLIDIKAQSSIEINNGLCVALILENNVPSLLSFLYLLSENLSIYILRKSDDEQVSIPKFCKYLIYNSSGDVCNGAEYHPMQITRNFEFNPNFRAHSFQHPSILMSTSGSSGNSKIVCYSKFNFLKNAENCVEYFKIGTNSKVLISVPVSHMYGLGVGLIPAIIRGANIHLISNTNVVKLLSSINLFRPEIVLVNPILCEMIMKVKKEGRYRNMIFITAGQIISSKTYNDFEDKIGDLFNIYGSSELGAIATSPRSYYREDQKKQGELIPFPNVEIKIDIDNNNMILCKHRFSFYGYLSDENRIIDKSERCNLDGWYLTNDSGIALSNEQFIVKGRVDNFINRSGYLVSLEEINEFVVQCFAIISEAVAFEHHISSTNIPVVAVVGEVVDLNDETLSIAQTLFKDLPRSKLKPDQLLLTKKIPRLASGKPDIQNTKKNILSFVKV